MIKISQKDKILELLFKPCQSQELITLCQALKSKENQLIFQE